jgi:hypothetical protein
MISVRTNNDVEGWHNRISSRMNSCGPLPFYLVLVELFKEATSIPLQARLFTKGKMQRLHKKRAMAVNSKLFLAWDKYNNRETSTSQLLRTCAEVYGPL